MALRSLNKLRSLRNLLVTGRRAWLIFGRGIDIDATSSISLSSRFISHRRHYIRVGPQTLIAFKTLLYTRDHASGTDRPITIGANCFIGGGSTIMPGVTVGDGSIIGAGSVVFDDVPPHSIAGGNPARVLRSNVEAGPYGRLKGADDNVKRMWR